jgi:hypothetical protein
MSSNLIGLAGSISCIWLPSLIIANISVEKRSRVVNLERERIGK